MSSLSLSAWIVDDDLTYQNFLAAFLVSAGFKTRGFRCGDEFLKNLTQRPDVIILDNNPDNVCGGVEFLRKIKERQPDVPVIYTGNYESVTLVSEAFRNGSMDFIEKDCASLIRIKIRLDKIKKLKMLRAKRRRSRFMFWASLLLLGVTSALILLTVVLEISIRINVR